MVDRHAGTRIIEGLHFPEGMRWHNGQLWFCDIESHEVINATADGEILERWVFPQQWPIGLAWMPDGELVIGGRFERLFRHVDGRAELLQDLCADSAPSWTNDIVIDAHGRTYVSSFGKEYDLEDHASNVERLKGAGRILLREADGSIRTVATGLSMPNTMQLTPDGGTLIVSDSMMNRVVSFPVLADGSLGEMSLVYQFDSMTDGSCLDAGGGLWVCLPHENAARRVLNGEITDAVAYDDEVFDVTLGGEQNTTLFAAVSNLSAASPVPEGQERPRPGHIAVVDVDVPGIR
jgi:sugar lactone lactonase YvrE